jgi:hypothetical protein
MVVAAVMAMATGSGDGQLVLRIGWCVVSFRLVVLSSCLVFNNGAKVVAMRRP